MTTKRLTSIAAAAVAAAALAPAAALADAELRGSPTLTQTGATTANLVFVVDEALPRTERGAIDARVELAGRGAGSVASWGRHGNDPRYLAGVRRNEGLTVGRRYTVRILVDGQAPIVRRLKLKPARG